MELLTLERFVVLSGASLTVRGPCWRISPVAPLPWISMANRQDVVQQQRYPHPCGFFNDPSRECTCTPPLIQRYVSKISGPLLDRIDIHIDMPAVRFQELRQEAGGESSDAIRARVIQARERQLQRFEGEKIYCNAQMSCKRSVWAVWTGVILMGILPSGHSGCVHLEGRWTGLAQTPDFWCLRSRRDFW